MEADDRRALYDLLCAIYGKEQGRFVQSWFKEDKELSGHQAHLVTQGTAAALYDSAIDIMARTAAGPGLAQFERMLNDFPASALRIQEVAERFLSPEERERLRSNPVLTAARKRLSGGKPTTPALVAAAELTFRVRGLRLRIAVSLRSARFDLPAGFVGRAGFLRSVVGGTDDHADEARWTEDCLRQLFTAGLLAEVAGELEKSTVAEDRRSMDWFSSVDAYVVHASEEQGLRELASALDDWLLLRETFVRVLERRFTSADALADRLGPLRRGQFGSEDLIIRVQDARRALFHRLVSEIYEQLRLREALTDDLRAPLSRIRYAYDSDLRDQELHEWAQTLTRQNLTELEAAVGLLRRRQRVAWIVLLGITVGLMVMLLVFVLGYSRVGRRLEEQKQNLSDHADTLPSQTHPPAVEGR